MPSANLIANHRGRPTSFGGLLICSAFVLFAAALLAQVQWDEDDGEQVESDAVITTADQPAEDPQSALAVGVESKVDPAEPAQDSTTAESEVGTQDLTALFVRLQRLENELLQAYGRIEELEHQVQTMRHEQRDRFVAIDRRLRELSGEVSTSDEALATAGANTEAGMYRVAFVALESREFQVSKDSFEAMIERYPNGKHVPDAFYWLGELNLQIEPRDLEEARQNFVQLINLYPTHVKAPEAMFKLGTVYHELGDISRALEYFDRVINDYPDVSVAQLARDYAANLR